MSYTIVLLNTSYTITLIGAVGNASIYNEQDIIRLLNTEQVALLHGDTFTGRPVTKIYISDDTVLKLHSEIRLEAYSAERWATQALQKEKSYQVHHPHKIWFIAEINEQFPVLIGNITPRLQPLHNLFTQKEVDSSICLNYLTQLFHYYFRLATTANLRLDEGLSNFGVTADGIVYYLDDDTYAWDRFNACAHTLGVYFRYLTWMTPETAGQFGQIVRQLILEYFNDSQYFIVLAEQLKDVFMPMQTQRQLLESFVEALTFSPRSRKEVQIDFSKTRYLALLSDIHANLPALETVLTFLKQQNIQQGIVLGDTVGYGPHPSQCIERVQSTGFMVLKGNHDHGLATDNFKKGFSRTASWALEWSVTQITPEQKSWLSHLPPLFHYENIWLAVHGAPIDPTFFNAYVYEMTYHNNLDVLQRKGISLCFHGHTHQAGVYGRRSTVIDKYCLGEGNIALEQFDHALICPGSVGQPRDGGTQTQFAIYDQQERKVYYHHLPYDVEKVIQLMKREGFPETLIKILQGQF
ncbi:MAG: hypothetical protein BWK79_06340 [Beggiatoa sp. IS2]|nr:MAG: hypothetical protein BWK79_06340 [Beggiatoa sp. IS2]